MPTVSGKRIFVKNLGFSTGEISMELLLGGTLYRSGVRKTGFLLTTFFVHETSVKTSARESFKINESGVDAGNLRLCVI
jgi:hypothetical protein